MCSGVPPVPPLRVVGAHCWVGDLPPPPPPLAASHVKRVQPFWGGALLRLSSVGILRWARALGFLVPLFHPFLSALFSMIPLPPCPVADPAMA